MENMFKLDGYSFIEIKSNNYHRPFRVRCIETRDEKDSAISYRDAAGLLIGQYNFAQTIIDSNNRDESYVRKVFTDVLLGRKKSECDNLVKSDIVEQERIRGEIISIQSQEKFAKTKEYITEYFIVTVHFENGIQRKSTNVLIKKRDENV
jgi:hypothetical protein